MGKRVVPSNDELARLYGLGMSATEIARDLGLSKDTVSSALTRAGISTRTPKETKKLQASRGVIPKVTRYWLGKTQPPEMVEKRISKIRGERHWLWKGGKSDRRDYRKVVEKDDCSRCGARMNLAIHHINYDHYDNRPENLAVVCVSCHASLHKQAYWNAVHSGNKPQRSNGPVGWTRKGVRQSGDSPNV